MSKRHRYWTNRLSEYLDRAMAADEREALEAHLAECGECRTLLAELRGIVEGAAGLGDLEPPRDLWPTVAAAIDPAAASGEGGKVLALPTAAGRRAGGRGAARVTLSPTQLAAASIALIAVSAVATLSVASSPRTGTSTVPTPVPVAVAAASQAVAPPESLAVELSELELALEAARGVLDPNTVRILERNLAVIEGAISDSQRALALDPGNEFLARHLERAYQRKLTYLRDAAQIVDWAS